jgi:hypothetical protein
MQMSASPLMDMLAAGVPITLLIDLLDADALDSVAINAVERPADDALWDDAAQVLAARSRALGA